jgi:hypothetical protein
MINFPDFDAINGWYKSTPKLWTIEMVGDAVKCGNITTEQYKEITGEDYVAPVA